MAKSVSTLSAKSRGASSAPRSRGAEKPSASSRSAKRMHERHDAIASISANEARTAKIDWAKVGATTDADVARHAREDRTATPSDRAWRKMVQDGRMSLVPPAEVDVRGIREKLHLSQSAFAAQFGFTAAAVRQWEQGRRQPHGPARVLLTIIDREPNAVRRALEATE